jgi:hypothetical protein
MSLLVLDPPLDRSSPTETVQRPPPGLARGRWEAPPWVFYALIVAALVGGLAWVVAGLRARRKGPL